MAEEAKLEMQAPPLAEQISSLPSNLRIKTSDGQVTDVNSQLAYMSKYVYTLVRDISKVDEIPFECEKKYLDLIIQYCEHHQFKEMPKIPKPISTSNMKELVHDQWDATWINSIDREDLYGLAIALNPLDIKCLLDLVCVKIAADFKELSWEQIQQIFGITAEFTPQAEEELLKKYPWASEESEEDLINPTEQQFLNA